MSSRTNDLSSELVGAFSVLELPPSADFLTVKTAYRELAKVWHPDRFEGDASTQHRAQEKLKQINAAYETLEKFFARQTSPRSPEAGEQKQEADSDIPTSQQSQDSGRSRSDQQVSAASWLIGSILTGIVVILVMLAPFPDGRIINPPNRAVEQSPATAPVPRSSSEPISTVLSEQPVSASDGTSQRTGGLTESQKLRYLQAKGLDPAVYEVDDLTLDVVKKMPKANQQPVSVQLPKNVKYVILAGGEQYFAEKEPRPFGSGFKFTDVLRKIDVVVNGNIQIIKVPPPKN